MRDGRVSREQKQQGAYAASQKLYHCENCGGLGFGNRFLNYHLINECKGEQPKKCSKTTNDNQDRLAEAMVNTKEWKIKKLKAESLILFKQFKSDAIRDIENMREINKEVVEDMLKSYGGTFF